MLMTHTEAVILPKIKLDLERKVENKCLKKTHKKGGRGGRRVILLFDPFMFGGDDNNKTLFISQLPVLPITWYVSFLDCFSVASADQQGTWGGSPEVPPALRTGCQRGHHLMMRADVSHTHRLQVITPNTLLPLLESEQGNKTQLRKVTYTCIRLLTRRHGVVW